MQAEDHDFQVPVRLRYRVFLPDGYDGAAHGPAWPLILFLHGSLRLVKALTAYGGNVRSTIYPGVGHDAWTRTYDNPELCAWLLQHRRRRES